LVTNKTGNAVITANYLGFTATHKVVISPEQSNGNNASGGTQQPSGNTGNTGTPAGGTSTPTTTPAPVVIEDNTPQAFEGDDAYGDAMKLIEAARKELKDSKVPATVIKELYDDVLAMLKAMPESTKRETVIALAQVTELALTKDISAEGAETMLVKFIENILTEVKSVSNAAMSSAVSNLLESYEQTYSKLSLVADDVPQASEGAKRPELKFSASDIQASIKKAQALSSKVASTLYANGVKQAHDKMIMIQVDGQFTLDMLFDKENVDVLKAAKYGVVIQSDQMNITLPASVFSGGSEIRVTRAETSETYSKLTKNGTVTLSKTFDLNVSSDQKQVGKKAEFELPLNGLDADSVMIGRYENDQWTKIPYTIKDGKVIFTPDHFSVYGLMTFNPKFDDVNHWAKKYITSLAAKGIVSGKNDTTFDPNGAITRAEFTTILVNHLNLNDDIISNFNDVSKDKWYYNFIARAAIHGINAGVSEGNFRPDEKITREEMAVMIRQAYKVKYGMVLSGQSSQFSDASQISDYAKDAVYAMKANGIISGYSDNTFKPLNTATRAEASTMIYNFLKK